METGASYRAVVRELSRYGINGLDAKKVWTWVQELAHDCADPVATVAAVRDWGISVIMGNCEESLGWNKDDCGCGFEEGTEQRAGLNTRSCVTGLAGAKELHGRLSWRGSVCG